MERNVYIKKEWKENGIIFYIHYLKDSAIRQIEVYSNRILRFSKEWNDILFDQPKEELDLMPNDYITREEFESVWNDTNVRPLVTFIPEGDIFEIEGIHSFAHGCNCSGTMGRGIASQFKERYPIMYKEYHRLCIEEKFRPGDVYDYSYDGGHIYNLGTQETWRTKARLEYIAESIEKMLTQAERDIVPAIALPAIGAGLGGLPWKNVKATIKNVARYHPHIDLYVVESYNKKSIKKEWK